MQTTLAKDKGGTTDRRERERERERVRLGQGQTPNLLKLGRTKIKEGFNKEDSKRTDRVNKVLHVD